MGSIDQGGGATGAGNFLDGDGIAYVIAAPAAVLFGIGQAHKVQTGQLADIFGREFLGFVDLSGPRRKLALGQIAHHGAHQSLLFIEFKLHGGLPCLGRICRSATMPLV